MIGPMGLPGVLMGKCPHAMAEALRFPQTAGICTPRRLSARESSASD